MDFIVKLPKSTHPVTKDKYDSILIIVDKLTKYSLIILFKKLYTAEQLGFIILETLIKDYSIPKAITSNRDKLFTSNYWKTFIIYLKIK